MLRVYHLLPGLMILAFLLGWPSLAAADKSELLAALALRESEDWATALAIWEWAEPGYQETRSAALLAERLEAAGFRVTRGVAGIPTAFTAEIGSGTPVLGILGEYDALPGLSQAAVPFRQPREDVEYGHGCGHHLFGAASASAAIVLGEQIQAGKLRGTVRYYGCPAEEGGSAKAFLVRDGLFRDVDAVLHWHPGSSNQAGDRSSLARIAVKFRFHGQSAHAAGSPEQGRSALDAVELTNHAAQLLREHIPEKARIHHVITAGGEAPNVVPAFAEVYYYVRHPDSIVVRQLYQRLRKCAEAGALATETRLEVVEEGGIVEILPNSTLAAAALRNLRELNDLNYDDAEREFALRLREALPKPEPLEKIREVADRSGTVGSGSTDVGDVSWVVPTTGFGTACWVPGTPGHSWQAVACGGTTIARKGMHLAARVLAATGWDVMTSPELLAAARAEHERRLQGRSYQPLIGPEQPPPLDYRRRRGRRRGISVAARGPAASSCGGSAQPDILCRTRRGRELPVAGVSSMQWCRRLVVGVGLVAGGYLLGSLEVLRLPAVFAQDEPQVGPGKDAENKIRAVHRALQEAMEQLRQDGRYNAVTDGVNAFLILTGGGDARQDLESGNGVDPETFAGIYAGKAIPEIAEELGTDDEGRITYNGKPITIYSRKRLARLFAERLRIKDAM